VACAAALANLAILEPRKPRAEFEAMGPSHAAIAARVSDCAIARRFRAG
jgi:hypothetical protein